MNRIFGKKKEPLPAISLSEAGAGINTRIEGLDAKIKGLDNELRRFKEQLKSAKGPTKASIQKRAMETLKRKKMYEQQRDQMAAQSFNLDQTSFAIESIKDTQLAVSAMKTAAVTLKTETKKMNINEIEDFQDDLADMFEDMEEINEIMGRSYGTPAIEDCDLEAELACLEDELDGDEIEVGQSTPSYLQPASTGSLPDAPSQIPVTSTSLPVSPPVEEDEYGLPVRPQHQQQIN
mmetsp:Transcript_16069/g.16200  ORF Transcript_16069/g.16200 Transcript_16069/m.16200 type:complete len:235 (-) Transcript_16069:162-866(-)|eukprot:CAMPEP_0182424962 /NCGR_PEP_ID=MMETSP1167-20130531/11273_1 /TAXON_ID=2988 /ORGANISM="Mallomonas Sp, Strain CCMP3275" /LENGTH=234 /DNA_ID=CAMNT_0024605203 /DNA_START=149 /DNA_END=853 /DNA_ORIENTATION=+